MQNLSKLLLASILLFCTLQPASAQNDAVKQNDIIKQGVELHNQGKFIEAIAQFNEVLKNDPQNAYANYEIAFSLYALKKPKEAIPHLEKTVQADNTSISVAAYALLGSIYDGDNQQQKAIEAYNKAIKINPSYPQIYYNLGIAYFRNQQYAEAENSAIEAIKKNPKHPGSQRLYALVTFHQNKRMNALMGLCSFLLLEPAGPRAAEAYGNIQHIIQGGVLTNDKGKKTIVLPAKDEKETNTLNLGLSVVVASSKTKNLSGSTLLEYQLKTFFALAGQLSEKKTDKTFFDDFFVSYFYKLSQSNNMPAFAHTIALTDKTSNNAQWNKDNVAQVNAFDEWVKSTERVF